MTNPIFNPQPNYSGVTIHISNPSVNVGQQGVGVSAGVPYSTGYADNPLVRCGNYSACPQACFYENGKPLSQIQNLNNREQISTDSMITDANGNPINNQSQYPSAYPAQYYLNNYNYGVNGDGNNTGNIPSGRINDAAVRENNRTSSNSLDNNTNSGYNSYNSDKSVDSNTNQTAGYDNESDYRNNNNNNNPYRTNDSEYTTPERDHSMNSYRIYADEDGQKQSDMSTSKEIIADLNDREAKIQEEKKNSKETKIVALTDEYIKSLENYLNNPNNEIRLMASKEILTRLDEDKDRYNDAALNALLNKMMQDPSKTVRVAALSAFASQLASGNDYTVKLLKDIQSNPNSDKEDVLQAADILLKMSAGVEVKNIPNPQVKENKQQ